MKHDAVEQTLRQMLLSGEGLSPEGRLPGERELALRFGVSRATVRRAVEALSLQGWLSRRHGRGTYLKTLHDPRGTQSIYSVTRCAQNYAELGMQPQVTVLRQQVEAASKAVAACLGLEQGGHVLLLEKLYRADRMVLNLSVSYLSLASFPGVERLDFSPPILEVLRAKYGAVPRKTENTLEAVLPSAEVARRLGVTEQTPILLFESLTTGILDGRGLPLEYYRTYHRTDRMRFRFEQAHEAVE